MPTAFLNCVASKGKVRTMKLSKDRYRHVCYLDGKTFLGEVKKKKKKST